VSANNDKVRKSKRASSPKTARRGATARPHAVDATADVSKADLKELFRFWAGETNERPPAAAAELRAQVVTWMTDSDVVLVRMEGLGKRLGSVLNLLLGAARYEQSMAELSVHPDLAYLSAYDLEAALAVLTRRGLAVAITSSAALGNGGVAYCVPVDVGDAVLRGRRSQRRGIFDTFTLRGHLDRIYDDPARAARTPPSRVRALYKMYAKEAAAVARIERLPEGLRALVQKVILEFGGILHRDLFERMDTELPHWNGRRWSKILADSLVGSVERLELGSYGIQHSGETLMVFNEVALAWLRRVAVPGDPDQPYDEASLGVDLVSNISRFIAFILENNVRFTMRGEIFKTTEKRILGDLIPNPGRELERAEVLQFIYHFAHHAELIESTGERTFALTANGRDWEPQSLEEKLRTLYEYIVEETSLLGEAFHQVRMRRLFLRMLKRIEAGIWYDIMYVPFLVRNQYLCSLDDLEVDEYFAGRASAAGGGASEDLQRMAWNLVNWVRKRLYLLGLVDLGYDAAGRPVAMRLTRLGARTIGVSEPDGEVAAVGSLVVTPDFEVVMIPTGDDGELVHDLDRFCERGTGGSLKQFSITQKSVNRALSEGMSLARMCVTLERNARTPVPQNVLYSIRDWANQAGLLQLDNQLVLRASSPEQLQELLANPGMRALVGPVVDEYCVSLKGDGTPARTRALLRELGYLVELVE
jgi:hypothetical protein